MGLREYNRMTPCDRSIGIPCTGVAVVSALPLWMRYHLYQRLRRTDGRREGRTLKEQSTTLPPECDESFEARRKRSQSEA